MKFPDAVQLINEQCGFFDSQPKQTQAQRKEKDTQTEFLLPERYLNNRRVTAYLLSRGIDIAVLDYCFQHGLLYESAEHHNAVFVGDQGKKPRYATLRSSLSHSSFKRDVAGSNKQFCFSITGQGGDKLNVFECAIDALSYLTQVKMQGSDWRQESILSLGGVYQSSPYKAPEIPMALQGYLDRHPEVQENRHSGWRMTAIGTWCCQRHFTSCQGSSRNRGISQSGQGLQRMADASERHCSPTKGKG